MAGAQNRVKYLTFGAPYKQVPPPPLQASACRLARRDYHYYSSIVAGLRCIRLVCGGGGGGFHERCSDKSVLVGRAAGGI